MKELSVVASCKMRHGQRGTWHPFLPRRWKRRIGEQRDSRNNENLRSFRNATETHSSKPRIPNPSHRRIIKEQKKLFSFLPRLDFIRFRKLKDRGYRHKIPRNNRFSVMKQKVHCDSFVPSEVYLIRGIPALAVLNRFETVKRYAFQDPK